jgi:transcriptional regulator with PAS, ATPase and Fis domain
MQDTRIKIGVITSSSSMANHIKQLQYNPVYDLWIKVNGLEEAIAVGEEMVNRGAEVIVSHIGTSNILQEHLQIPVISVPHSSLDLLSAIQEATTRGKRILIPNFREKLSNLGIIRKLFPVEIKQGIYRDTVSLNDLIRKSKKKGINVVIGGGLGVTFAEMHGMQGIEIKASSEAISASLDSAVSVVLANRKEKAHMRRLYNILDSVAEGIVSVDQDGVIMTVNSQAKSILRLGDLDITNSDYRDHLPWGLYSRVLDTQTPIIDRLERINDQLYLFNYSPVFLENKVVGCISTFQEASKIMRSENEDLALEVVSEIGSGNSFLMHSHTFERMKSQSISAVFNRQSCESWMTQKSSKPVTVSATEQVLGIIENLCGGCSDSLVSY